MSGVYDETDWFTARQIAEVVDLYRLPGHRTSVSGIIRWIKEQKAGRYGWRFEGRTARWYGKYRGATAYHWSVFVFDGALCSALMQGARRRRKNAGEVKKNLAGLPKGGPLTGQNLHLIWLRRMVLSPANLRTRRACCGCRDFLFAKRVLFATVRYHSESCNIPRRLWRVAMPARLHRRKCPTSKELVGVR